MRDSRREKSLMSATLMGGEYFTHQPNRTMIKLERSRPKSACMAVFDLTTLVSQESGTRASTPPRARRTPQYKAMLRRDRRGSLIH